MKKIITVCSIVILVVLILSYVNNFYVENKNQKSDGLSKSLVSTNDDAKCVYYGLGESSELIGITQKDGKIKYSTIYELKVADTDVGSAIRIDLYIKLNNHTNELENYDVIIDPIGARLLEKSEFKFLEHHNIISGNIKLSANKDEKFKKYIDKQYYERFSNKLSIENLTNLKENIYENDDGEVFIEFIVKNEWQGIFDITLKLDKISENKLTLIVE
ncbi:hypothetical protein JYG23_07810 [Sedimentibacter sp. zth1]|uniref:hypothetical protein n=1 Tax=Sedimentibacter sp. zth1 TaxID=2816908 RepID=UPI001A92A599|nr:hypothetical protein [Sedimentibacter sp. zth1]QSX07238.1 hypothetical protein JYG23_07810 [Sedimentibacter sp. zth1]